MMQIYFVPSASCTGWEVYGLLLPKKFIHSRGGFALPPEGHPDSTPAEATGTGSGSPWR